jgi:hypothetical protein
VASGIFWDIDTQCDFMRVDGTLYVPHAESIIPNVQRLTDPAHRRSSPSPTP